MFASKQKKKTLRNTLLLKGVNHLGNHGRIPSGFLKRPSFGLNCRCQEAKHSRSTPDTNTTIHTGTVSQQSPASLIMITGSIINKSSEAAWRTTSEHRAPSSSIAFRIASAACRATGSSAKLSNEGTFHSKMSNEFNECQIPSNKYMFYSTLSGTAWLTLNQLPMLDQLLASLVSSEILWSVDTWSPLPLICVNALHELSEKLPTCYSLPKQRLNIQRFPQLTIVVSCDSLDEIGPNWI